MVSFDCSLDIIYQWPFCYSCGISWLNHHVVICMLKFILLFPVMVIVTVIGGEYDLCWCWFVRTWQLSILNFLDSAEFVRFPNPAVFPLQYPASVCTAMRAQLMKGPLTSWWELSGWLRWMQPDRNIIMVKTLLARNGEGLCGLMNSSSREWMWPDMKCYTYSHHLLNGSGITYQPRYNSPPLKATITPGGKITKRHLKFSRRTDM